MNRSANKPRRVVLEDVMNRSLPFYVHRAAVELHLFVAGVWIDLPIVKNVVSTCVADHLEAHQVSAILADVEQLADDQRVRYQDVVDLLERSAAATSSASRTTANQVMDSAGNAAFMLGEIAHELTNLAKGAPDALRGWLEECAGLVDEAARRLDVCAEHEAAGDVCRME